MFENGSQIHYRVLVALPVLLAAAPVAPTVSPDDQEHARRLVSLLDYVSGDYARAVVGGHIALPSEYQEQLGMLKDAEEVAAELPRTDPSVDPLAGVRHLEEMAAHVASGEALAAEIGAVRRPVIIAYMVPTAPASPPSLEKGRELYQVACAACHGAEGHADTQTAAQLDPHPPRFDDPARMDPLSPFRAFNAVSFGVKGTAMPAYETLDDAQKWDLATYVFTLRDPSTDAGAGAAILASAGRVFSATRLSALTDGEISNQLRPEVGPDNARMALAWLRNDAAYAVGGSGDLSAVRSGFRRAVQRYTQGAVPEARSALMDTYLEGFEPKEPALRAHGDGRVDAVENAYAQVRAGVDQGQPADVVARRAARLDALLESLEEGAGRGSSQVAFWGSLIIVLREGLEAALLVAALLAILKKTNRTHLIRWVHLGWLGALVLGWGMWVATGRLVVASGAHREELEGVAQLVTAAFLIFASHWLLARSHAQKLMGQVSQATGSSGGAAAVLSLSFLAVSREMLEVVVFYRGLLLETRGQESRVALGAGVGALALGVFVAAFLRVGRRLPIRPFLVGCGALLCGLAVVMVGHGVRSLQEADWIRLTPMGIPSVPTLGLYDSVEGLLAQAAVLVGLAISAAWSMLHSSPVSPVPRGTSPASR